MTSRRHAVVLSLDTLGDQVLRQPLFRALTEEGWRVSVVARRAFVPLLPLVDARLELVATDLHPHQHPDRAAWQELYRIEEAIRALAPIEMLIAAAYDRTWADDYLLRRFPDVRRVGFDVPLPDVHRLDRLLPADVEPPGAEWNGTVAVEADDHEAVRQRKLAEAALAHPVAAADPRIEVPADALEAARAALSSLGLAAGEYAIGCPAGVANVSLKEWEPGQFAAVVAHLERRHGVKTLLIGSRPEQPLLAEVTRRAASEGASPGVWVGEPSDLTTLVGLIAQARLFVGNDTGPMHLAAALGLPVVARFGGGHWRAGAPEPRFQPLAPRAVVLTRGLECFGCGWQCWLDHAACMSLVPLTDVLGAVDRLLAPGPPERHVIPGPPLPEPAALLVREGARAWRAQAQRLRDMEADREARLIKVNELTSQVHEVTQELALIQADREARLVQVVELTTRLADSEADRAARLTQIHDLTAIVNELQTAGPPGSERVADLALRLREIERDRDDRLRKIQELTSRLSEIETERGARLVQIEELSAHLADLEIDGEERIRTVRELTSRLGQAEIEAYDRTAQLSELTTRVAEIEADRATRLDQIHTLNAMVHTLNTTVQELRARLAELDRTLTVRVSRRLGLIRTAR